MSIYLASFLAPVCVMLLGWVLYVVLNQPGFVDCFWSVAITATCFTIFLFSQRTIHQVLPLIVIVLWMLRLSGYLLLTQIIPGRVHERYEMISAGWTIHRHLGFLFNYLFQALLAWMVGSVFFFVARVEYDTVIYWFGLVVMILGFIIEIVSDYQLSRYRKKPVGPVCEQGLWAYSRHPNLFGDWLIWLGASVLSFTVTHGWLGLFSPLILFCVMNFITIPITEKQSLINRGDDYAKYQQRVSQFFVWKRDVG